MVNCEAGASKERLQRYAHDHAGGAAHVQQLRLVGGGHGVDVFKPPGQKEYSGYYPYHLVIDGGGTVRMSGGYDWKARKWLDYMAAAALHAQPSSWQLHG
mmetsp:Transcript_50333/g.107837  ORF Transcript_50333/g.107837 Transcript_50333/m.107837 type:complete len:100 (-) Transcript_50333:124-423(-)